MSDFWYAEIIKELDTPETKDLFDDPQQVAILLKSTVEFIELNCLFPKRINQYFKTFVISDADQLKFLSEKLELMLEESEQWKNIEYMVIHNPSFNYDNREQHTETYSQVNDWIASKSGRKIAQEVSQKNEVPRTVVNHPEFFLSDVTDRIKHLPFIEKIKYIESVKHKFDIEINKLDFYKFLTDETDHLYEVDFLIKCDAEIKYQKKIREIELTEQKPVPLQPNAETSTNSPLNKSHFASSINNMDSPQKSIIYSSFEHYLKQFEYNYPYRRSVFEYKYSMKDYLGYIKTEILDNLILLSKDNRKPYLIKLKYELQSKKIHAYTTRETIDEWLSKFDLKSDDEIRSGEKPNELYTILDSEPPKMEDEFAEGFNRDTSTIQTDFYNYYYGFYLDTAIQFIEEQIKEHSPAQPGSTLSQQSLPPATPKLKVNLTVPQLAYLFKMLHELKPDIFDIETKTELYRFIASNFITKATKDKGISPDSLNNLFSDTDKKVANYWVEHLKTMLEKARKV